jgi:twitching motility two-component system response regulator PilG
MSPQLKPALRNGIAAAHARQFDEARQFLAIAAAEAPDHAAVWFWSAVVSANPTSAVESLRRAVSLDPTMTQAREALGRLLVGQAVAAAGRDRSVASALAAEAAKMSPKLDAAWIAVAALSDEPLQVLDALRRAVSASPQRAELKSRLHDALLRQAVAVARAQQTAAARALFQEAAALDPSDVRTWQALARLAESPAEAMKPLRELARLQPNDTAVQAALQRAIAAASPSPVRAAVPPAQPPRSAAPAPAPQPAQPPAKTVMVVDDSATIRKILALTLEGAGYAVVAEPDGERAVERLAQFVPDLILLDITMPKMDGYEVCKRIRKDARTARVPVVMLSGKDGFFDKVKGRMVGATEYLTKPFQAPAVLAVIARHCGATQEAIHG